MSLGQSLKTLEANVMPIVGVFAARVAQADDQLFHWPLLRSAAQELQPSPPVAVQVTIHSPPIYSNTSRG